VHVLGQMVGAVQPGGIVLDLQVIRPNPRVESGGRLVCELDGAPLFVKAHAAVAAIEAAVAAGSLVEEAVDDHDVLKHYADGADLVGRRLEAERAPADGDLRGCSAGARGAVRDAGALPPSAAQARGLTRPRSDCPRTRQPVATSVRRYSRTERSAIHSRSWASLSAIEVS